MKEYSVFAKTIVLITILIFIGASVLPSTASRAIGTCHSETYNFNGKTLYVGGNGPNNYTTIETAVNHANCGDTIFVCNGNYLENIVIDKSINLIGQNKYETIIDGGHEKENITLIMVTAENVRMSGFTVQNAKGIDGRAMMILKRNGNGYTRNNIITDNIFKNCSYGVMVVNPINNTVANNTLYGCCIGPYITRLPYYKNYFCNNTVNDKPALLFVNQKNFCIDGEETDYIDLVNCKNVEIHNLSISNVTVGMGISYSSKIKVINNTICNTSRGGIYVHHSSRCTFIGNTFENDNWGIFLRKSHFNKIHHNNFINISMPDWFASSYFNNWNENYWGEPFSLPRKIFGKIGPFENIPWYNFDWHPALVPYEP